MIISYLSAFDVPLVGSALLVLIKDMQLIHSINVCFAKDLSIPAIFAIREHTVQSALAEN